MTASVYVFEFKLGNRQAGGTRVTSQRALHLSPMISVHMFEVLMVCCPRFIPTADSTPETRATTR